MASSRLAAAAPFASQPTIMTPSSTTHADLDSMQSEASTEDEPTVSTDFLLNDCTALLILMPGGSDTYSFPHPLLTKSIHGLFEHKAADLSLSCCSAVHDMIPPNYPVEPQHRHYMDKEIGKFLDRVAREAAVSESNPAARITCSIGRGVRYEETAEFA